MWPARSRWLFYARAVRHLSQQSPSASRYNWKYFRWIMQTNIDFFRSLQKCVFRATQLATQHNTTHFCLRLCLSLIISYITAARFPLQTNTHTHTYTLLGRAAPNEERKFSFGGRMEHWFHEKFLFFIHLLSVSRRIHASARSVTRGWAHFKNNRDI